MHYQLKGFTLIEATTVLAVAAVLLAVAVPAWRNAISAAHNGQTRAALANTVLEAVRHSAITGSEVVMCADTGGAQCSGNVDWSDGWIVFADLNGNRLRDPAEILVKQASALKGGVRLRSTIGRTRVVFQPSGSNAGSNVTFTLCNARGSRKASTLVLANNGRLRQDTPTAAAVRACIHGG